MKTLTDEQYLKAAEYQKAIYEIDELLKHAQEESVLTSFCVKNLCRDGCPIWIPDADTAGEDVSKGFCPLLVSGVSKLDELSLELIRRRLVRLLDEIDPDFELDEKRLEVTKKVDAVKRFRERYIGANHDHQ